MNRKFSWTASVTALYVILILAVHPIIYQDYYFNILNVKYLFYCACTIGMLILLGGYFIFTGAFKRIKLKLIPTDYAFLAFIVTATLSAAFSDFKYEAFWGNEGRFSGAFLLILYAASYFCVSRLLKFKSWFMDIALLSCMAVCIFGFTDYLGMDLLHFKVRLKTEHMDMFTSFIGNINMYTGLLSVYLGAACLLWVSCPNK